MKKRYSWWGRAVGFAVNLLILSAVAYAVSTMWRAPVVWAMIDAMLLSIPTTLFTWWIAEHPDDAWGSGYHPNK